MSKIDELIEKLCPNGVEYKSLAQLCGTITTGKLNANAMVENGIYPFYTCDFTPFRINEYAFDEEAILISGNGSQIGHINYYKGKFNAYQRTYVLYNFIEINVKFLLHYLSGYLKNYILIHCKKGSVPYITLPILQNFSVPVPPMEVQCEIVHILDDFTELSKELSKELKDRQKQFAYYRDELLLFENEKYPQMKLADIATEMYRGAGIKRTEITEDGIQCVRYGEIYTTYNVTFNKCVSHTNENIISSKKYFEYGDVLFAITGENVEEIGKSIVYLGNKRCLAGGDIVVMKHKQNPKYMAFALSTTTSQIQKSKGKVKSKVVHSSVPSLKEITIPLPPLNVQEKIANILEKFYLLCNDKSEGLPAEIELRQKQYEYYRDKLLTFKEIKVNKE